MIDIKQLIKNPTLYKVEMSNRSKDETIVDRLVESYSGYLTNLPLLDALRAQKNTFNETIVSLTNEQKNIAIVEMKKISDEIKTLELKVKTFKDKADELLYLIPNLTSPQTPIGKDDSFNCVIETIGQKKIFDFVPVNYYDLPLFKRDYLGQKGVEAFGSRGYYIKGKLAKVQKALFEFVSKSIETAGFEYISVPIMINEKTLYGTGFFPGGIEDTYSVTSGDKTFYLVGTSEAPLMYLHSNTTLSLSEPVKITAQTPCFRKEAGSYGKDVAGGIRVHQFDKVEMVVICKPEESQNVFEELVNLTKSNINELGLNYQLLEISTGDISIKNHRQVDVEAWFPAQGQFRELCSASNCTDYQTRTLNITYINKNGDKEIAHSLNCTGVVNRFLYAILEQNQQFDGSVILPQGLANIVGFKTLD